MKYPKYSWWWLVLCLSACKGIQQGKKITRYLTQTTDTIHLSSTVNRVNTMLELHYTGAGGMLIRRGQHAIYVDPFFSNPGPLLGTLFNRAKSDTNAIRRYFQRTLGTPQDRDGVIKAVLVSHAHYDHIMDIPVLWHLNLLNQAKVRFLGSYTAAHYLRGAGVAPGQISVVAKAEASDAGRIGKKYEFGHPTPVMRVYPVVNAHAPHTRFLGMPIKFFKGKAKQDKWPKKLAGFKEGQTYAYLIDFLDEQAKINCRIFVQTSSSNAPNGFIPKALKVQHPIDIAIMGVASYKYVKTYPQELIKHLQPHHVIMIHWENFFCGLNRLNRQPRAVPFNDIRKFVKKIDRLMNELGHPDQWTLPQVNTKLWVRFDD